jgi:hypothetical protein
MNLRRGKVAVEEAKFWGWGWLNRPSANKSRLHPTFASHSTEQTNIEQTIDEKVRDLILDTARDLIKSLCK